MTSFSFLKKLKFFNEFYGQNLYVLWLEYTNNGDETRSDIFQRDLFKSDIISFLSKNITNVFFKIKISRFYDDCEPK